EKHIHTAAFITSQCADISPWPVSEGLCTLEQHRSLSLELQARHLKMLNLTDDILIGNAYASEEELKEVKQVNENSIDTLNVVFYEGVSDLEKRMVCETHDYRGDASEYMIRSSHNRRKFSNDSVVKHDIIRDIHKGDILILNDDYGQYKGEVQIALKDRDGDDRINVVGRICEDELILVDALKPYQQFELREK
ncbi:MAG: phospho-sugar glycosidase domain-containing protein, partial [Coprobacillus sp.]